jgi:hypothetical protein
MENYTENCRQFMEPSFHFVLFAWPVDGLRNLFLYCRTDIFEPLIYIIIIIYITPWLESARELYRPRDRRLSAKFVPTFADRGVSHSQCGGSPTAVISDF